MNGNCWKCGLPISDECPSDGLIYTSFPPRYAHKNCPPKCSCPNCGQDLVDSVCTCGHDGLRGDCGCEFCSTPPTADIPPMPEVGTSVLYRCFYWLDVADAMEKASWEQFRNSSLRSDDEPAIAETYYRKWLGS